MHGLALNTLTMHPIESHFFGASGLHCLFAADDDGNTAIGYITKQVGVRSYVVTNGDVTKTCTLARLQSDVASEATMPVGLCTFLLSPFVGDVEHVDYLTSRRCSTIEGNTHAWHLTAATERVAQIIRPAPSLTADILAKIKMDDVDAFFDGVSGAYKIADTGATPSRCFCWFFGDGSDPSIFQDDVTSGDRGMVFDGTTRIAERTYDAGINDTEWSNDTLTAMIRFQTTTLTTLADRIMLGVATAWRIFIAPNGRIKLTLDPSHTIDSGINVASDVLYDVAFTYSTVTEELLLYVNGVQVGTPITALANGIQRPANVPLTIGGTFTLSYPTGENLFGGTIWDVKTYSTALSASTIAYFHAHRELGET